jgi:GGDEF domain-containing protein
VLKLRIGLGLIIVWLFVLYNIERLGEPLNISTFVYLLVPIIGALLAFIPALNRRDFFLLFLLALVVSYIVLKQVLNFGIFGTVLPLTILELGALFVSAILFRHVLLTIFDFEDLLQQLTFRQLGMPPRLVASLEAEELYRELKRSRRFENPLVFSVLSVDVKNAKLHETALMSELRNLMFGRFLQAKLANIISDELRDSDYIVQYGNGFAVLMPETESEDARLMLNELRSRVQKELGVPLKVGTASFPENAFTLQGLISHARKHVESPEVPAPSQSKVGALQ